MKKIIIILGFVAIALIIGVILFFQFSSLAILVGGRPPEVKNEVWQGIDIELTAPLFGSISNVDYNEFCGSNDGNVVLSNSYTISDKFSLRSTIGDGSDPGNQCWGNYIQAEFEVPPGKLTGICQLNVGTAMGDSLSICKIGSFASSLAINERELPYGAPTSKTAPFELIFDEPTTILVKLSTNKAYLGSAIANINFDFQPECISDANCPGGYCSDGKCVASPPEPPTPTPIVIKFFRDIWQDILDFFRGIF